MIRKILQSVRQYKKASIITPIAVAAEVAVEVIIPYLMASLIDYGITDGNMSFVVKMGITLAILAMFEIIFGVLSGKYAAIASAGLARNLRHDLYKNVQSLSFSNIDKFSTASIVTRLTTDVTNVQNAYQVIIRIAVRAPIMLIFALIMTFTINAQLSWIFIVTIPILAFGLGYIIVKAYPLFKKVFKDYDHLNNVVEENVRGIRVVKSFVREDYEKKKFHRAAESLFRHFLRADKLIAFNSPLMQFCMYGCMILISWFGANLIITTGNDPVNGFSTGQLMSLITYTMQILSSLMIVAMILVMINISRASAERVVELLNEKGDIVNPKNPILAVKDGSIQFKNVNFSYVKDKTKPCLKEINLTINSGEMVGIIGATGSSKTSLMQLIPRLYDVTEGQVLVGGIDVRQYDLKTLRNEVAIVLQKNELFSGTIKENLRWGNPKATDKELVRVCKIAQADDFIRQFPKGYDTHIEQGGSNVSGGQKQRICIARALLKNPKILVLDDSTSAIDTITDAKLQAALYKEVPNLTKLVIAQRVTSIEHADKTIVLNNGRVDAVGAHKDLLKNNIIYKEVYESQIKKGAIHG